MEEGTVVDSEVEEEVLLEVEEVVAEVSLPIVVLLGTVDFVPFSETSFVACQRDM